MDIVFGVLLSLFCSCLSVHDPFNSCVPFLIGGVNIYFLLAY